MPSIYELVTANALSVYWTELNSNRLPYLGAALFPAKRMMGLKLSWIRGVNNLPVMLAPSAFDTKPTLRDRGGVNTFETKMPFFRESMRIGEEDRQQMLQLLQAGGNYIQPILTKIFDDASVLIDGALVIPEAMIWELLQTGKISIQSPNTDGLNVNYNYNYDVDSTWLTSNLITAGVAWAQAAANPIKDILAVKRLASAKGVSLVRGVMSPATWAKLVTNASFAADLQSKTALSDMEVMQYISAKTGMSFYVNEKMYKDYSGTDRAFMKDDTVVFMPTGALGSTYYGTTPEEADLMSGNKDAVVSIVNSGVAIGTKTESLPVNVITWVAEIVLPSFERMSDVYNLKVV